MSSSTFRTLSWSFCLTHRQQSHTQYCGPFGPALLGPGIFVATLLAPVESPYSFLFKKRHLSQRTWGLLSAYNGYWLLVMILGAAPLSLALFCSLSPELPAGTKTGMRRWVPYGFPLEIQLSLSSALKSSHHHDKEKQQRRADATHHHISQPEIHWKMSALFLNIKKNKTLNSNIFLVIFKLIQGHLLGHFK